MLLFTDDELLLEKLSQKGNSLERLDSTISDREGSRFAYLRPSHGLQAHAFFICLFIHTPSKLFSTL